jgi:ABC-type branched-subunit amino acid transport system substrate-binding protein
MTGSQRPLLAVLRAVRKGIHHFIKLRTTTVSRHIVSLLVAADALKRAGSQTSQAIRTALDKTFLVTPFGPVKFYSYYDFERQNSVRTQVLQVIEGAFQCVWPPDLATAKFVSP